MTRNMFTMKCILYLNIHTCKLSLPHYHNSFCRSCKQFNLSCYLLTSQLHVQLQVVESGAVISLSSSLLALGDRKCLIMNLVFV